MSNLLDPLVGAGVELMLVGMGTVFLFLTLLVFVVKLMSALVSRFVTPESPVTPATVSPNKLSAAIPAAHVAAIAAAIDQHKNR